MGDRFKAVRLDQVDGATKATIAELDSTDLPAGEVLVHVAYSTLNYKDALAITGAGKIVRQFPFVPGIDFAGTVASSSDPHGTRAIARVGTGDSARNVTVVITPSVPSDPMKRSIRSMPGAA